MGIRFALKAIWLLVLLPTAVVAAFWSLMAIGVIVAALRGTPIGSAWGAVATSLLLVMGWFGIATLSRLCTHFQRSTDCPPYPRAAAIGLICGCIVSVVLMIVVAGSTQFRVVLFGWPLLGAIPLGYLLGRSWKRDGHSSVSTALNIPD